MIAILLIVIAAIIITVRYPLMNDVQLVMESFWENRGDAARSGKHMTSIHAHLADIFNKAGFPVEISTVLPGWYRRSKSWDIVVTHEGFLIAAIEFKSQVGSVGKNANNRIEESIGNAIDIRRYHDTTGAFGCEPWLGYIFVLEDSEEASKELQKKKTMYPLEEDFKETTYVSQYQTAFSRLVEDGVYDAAWFVLTKKEEDGSVTYREPSDVTNYDAFFRSLKNRISSFS